MAELPGPRGTPSHAWRRLWRAARPDASDHAIDLPTLGEYAAVRHLDGRRMADTTFPAVARHLGTGCSDCEADLREIAAMLRVEDRTDQ